jgi:hypothetical protein
MHAVKSASQPVRSVIGGGTAGWMTAASLSIGCSASALITLVESTTVGTIGVGEATVPAIRRYFQSLNLGCLRCHEVDQRHHQAGHRIRRLEA